MYELHINYALKSGASNDNPMAFAVVEHKSDLNTNYYKCMNYILIMH